MIVSCQLPAGKFKAAYGASELGVNDDGTVDVPKYVAKTLVAAGATCPDPLAGTVAGLLAATTERFEANYIFGAYARDPGDLAAANDLLASRGEPVVVFG